MNNTATSIPYNQIVILDFDGVIADTLQAMLSFSDEVALEIGYPHRTTFHDLDVLQPMSFANLGRQIGIPENLIPTYVNLMVTRFANSEIPFPIFPGMAEAILDLAEDSYLAVVSGNDSKVIQSFLVYYNIAPMIQCIYGVDNPGTKIDKIMEILVHIPVFDRPVFMVGDATSDIEAAHQCGVIAVAVGWGHQSREKLLAAHPELFISTPQELANKIRCYSKPTR